MLTEPLRELPVSLGPGGVCEHRDWRLNPLGEFRRLGTCQSSLRWLSKERRRLGTRVSCHLVRKGKVSCGQGGSEEGKWAGGICVIYPPLLAKGAAAG